MILKPPAAPEGLDYDGERFVPGADSDSQVLHYHRYLSVLDIVRGKDVLDIASGEGFGSWFLSQTARSVVGIDLADKAVAHAGRRYVRANLRYKTGDCINIPLDDKSVDVVVSFETLEHLTGHDEFMKEVRRVLRPNGVLAISTPEKAAYNAALDQVNPFHLRELSRSELHGLLSQNFTNFAIYGQAVKLASIIWPEPSAADHPSIGAFRKSAWDREQESGIDQSSAMPDPVILIAIASDGPIEGIGGAYQEFPYAFPVSAIEGGAKERMQQAFAVERAELQAENAQILAELGALSGQLHVYQASSGAIESKKMKLNVQRWKRKKLFYDAIVRLERFLGEKFIRRMRQKSTKYAKMLGDLSDAKFAPMPINTYDMTLIKSGNPSAVSRGETAGIEVTIVIPVYNQIDFTLACLRSLARHETSHRFEVIVVDDCSSDRTQDELSAIPWIRYIRQSENGGFIESCNTGLANSFGKFVVFLNNDTEVLAGWLDELVQTFKLFPKAGLVGSKLLYPDGSLQEAGGILWKDGSAWNYGRNQEPDRPEYCYVRKVDYCSGASLMAPRELLQKLSGFDPHYAPAYCEDADLAMRVRATGLDVLYQPLSKIVHYEGISSGTNIGSGVKAYQVANQVKLFERWKDTLALRPENGEVPSSAKDFGIQKRLLVIDAITPEPDRDAGSVTCVEIMRAAQSLGYQVSFIPESNFADLAKYTAAIQREGIEALYGPYCTRVRDHLIAEGRRYDAIMVYRVGILWRYIEDIKRYAPRARIVYQTSDLHHLRVAREAELTGDAALAAQAEYTKTRELDLVAKSDCTIVHSLYEKDHLQTLLPMATVEVFNWILEPVGTNVGFEKRNGIMFLGGYQHTPNVDAVNFFLDKIWPLVEPRLPGTKFYVVGSNLPDELAQRRSSTVEMVGFVEDLQPVMDKCRMSVVPLRFGAGTKGKLAMSFAYGLPAVSTSIGAEGMGLVDGEATFIADDPAVFADRIVELHQSQAHWERMSAQSLDYVTNNLSRRQGIEVIRRALAATA